MSVSGGDIVIELALDDKNFQVNVKNAGTLLRQMQGQFDQTARSVKRLEDAQLSLGRRFRDLVLTLGNLRFVAMDVNDIFLRLPMSILKTAGELEKTQLLMQGLSKAFTDAGRAAEGAADFNFVTNMAKNVPYTLQAISDSFVKLKVAGIDPTKGSAQALFDSVAKYGGTSEQLKRASVAISQMSGKGVISMEELRQQMAEAVPDSMRLMAEAMGLSMNELVAKISKGTVEANTALEKLFVRMRVNNAGSAEAMMKSWEGMTARLRSEWELTSKFIADAGLGQEAKAVIQQLTDALKSDEFKRFALEVGGDLGAAVKAIASGISTLVEFRTEIGMIIKAWLLYKAGTAFLYPMLKASEGHFATLRNAMRSQAAGVLTAANDQRAAAIRNLELSLIHI